MSKWAPAANSCTCLNLYAIKRILKIHHNSPNAIRKIPILNYGRLPDKSLWSNLSSVRTIKRKDNLIRILMDVWIIYNSTLTNTLSRTANIINRKLTIVCQTNWILIIANWSIFKKVPSHNPKICIKISLIFIGI